MAFRFGMDDLFGNMDRMMNQMMNGMFDPSAMSMAMSPYGQQQGPHNSMISPFAPFSSMMMQTSMPAGGASFVSSSFVSYSSDGSGRPQIYEETQTNHIGPGGVREERHTVKDSRTGVQKMKVGRHIKDRGHVVERSKNHYTGDEEENNEYVNIEEEEAPQFHNEWSARMAAHRPPSSSHGYTRQLEHDASRNRPLAIMAPPAPESLSPPQQPQTSHGVTGNSADGKIKTKVKNLLKNKKPKKPYNKN